MMKHRITEGSQKKVACQPLGSRLNCAQKKAQSSSQISILLLLPDLMDTGLPDGPRPTSWHKAEGTSANSKGLTQLKVYTQRCTGAWAWHHAPALAQHLLDAQVTRRSVGY